VRTKSDWDSEDETDDEEKYKKKREERERRKQSEAADNRNGFYESRFRPENFYG
jgi:hypothetical protein